MSSTLVSAHGIGKRYVIGSDGRGTLSLRDRMTDAVRSLGRRPQRADNRAFWALRNVDFEVHEGEAIGVIGRNGAGKSTLLKLISEITEPTEGEIRLYGRVAGLLEVGVGFHPELSGRENVYLNGAILGMSRAEVRRKFDEIVAFAEVERFIDTPVKRYSSGMYVRLAFAVAAHLEPDVLMVDEVLAVGDIAFQRKCLGKMESVAKSRRAVVVVSHNMSLITQLCERVMWLDRGQLIGAGPSRELIGRYLATGASTTYSWSPPPDDSSSIEVHSVSVNRQGGVGGDIAADEPFEVVFDYSVKGPVAPGRLAILISTSDGQAILASASTDDLSARRAPWMQGHRRSRCLVPAPLLAPGTYLITISQPLDDGGDVIHDGALQITISEQNSLATRDGRRGLIAPRLQWIEDEAP